MNEDTAAPDGHDPTAAIEAPIAVPWQALSAGALAGVIESFVLREGTDYGEREISWPTKCDQVRRQLERGEAWVMFDPQTDSVSIVAAQPQTRRPTGR